MIVQTTGDNLHYRWQKDGIDLSDDDRYCDTDTDTLHIVKVEMGDSKAHYRCHVKNETGEEFSREAVLTVSKLVIDCKLSLAAKHTEFFLLCMMLSKELILVRWVWYTCTHTLPLEFDVPLMNSPTTETADHNWTQIICLFLLVLFGTLVGIWWLLCSVGKSCTVCAFE